MDYLCLQVGSVLLDVSWIALLASDMNSQNLEHLTEIAEILALGLQRLIARQSSELSADSGEKSLHCDAGQSGHAGPVSPEVPHE
jgi:hypothetical protein